MSHLLFSILLVASCLGINIPPVSGKVNRIIGGINARIEDHPYQVSLRYGNKHNCGGSLIGRQWILTAAHCIAYAEYNVRIGSSDTQVGGSVYTVKTHYMHPEYSDVNYDYDFALLELNEPVTVSDKVQIVKLANHGEELVSGSLLNVTGWGETQTGKPSPLLQVVEVPLVDQKVCAEAYNTTNITGRMFCAGFMDVGGKDSCQGDSGGPAVHEDVQYGVVSWGKGCARPGYPGVYAKISAVREWIEKISGV